MAKKNRFMQALDIANDVAGLVGSFKDAQRGVQAMHDNKQIRKAFDQGNATNLAAAEGARSQGSMYKPKFDGADQFKKPKSQFGMLQ
tara:strand:+ start:45 stop:305 length:261 start_codon:yes stop_codon:yes gene_type:complete